MGFKVLALNDMKLGKRIERAIKSLYLAPLTIVRYGTLRPQKVKLSDCDNWIHIDPIDRRAVKKFIQDPLRKRTSPPLVFWRDFLAKLTPHVAIDVGVNYGECLFGARYGSATTVYGFEANPKINECLKKSRSDHPDGERIHIIASLVSDIVEEAVDFYVDPSWSGTGSAVRSLNDGANVITSSIPAVTIDSVIPTNLIEGGTLLVKMDIEGYEPRAFGGLQKTIDAAKLVVGFIEFDTTFIREAGSDAEIFYQTLESTFDVYFVANWRQKLLKRADRFAELPQSRAEDQRVHTDLLLVTRSTAPSAWLPNGWSIL